MQYKKKINEKWKQLIFFISCNIHLHKERERDFFSPDNLIEISYQNS